MRALSHWCWLALITLCASQVRGQQQAPPSQGQQQQQSQAPQQSQGQVQPIPAAQVPVLGGVFGTGDVQANAPAELVPDDHSLVGAQRLSLGAPKTGHSFWQPYFDVSLTFDSNPLATSTAGSNSWVTWTSLLAGVNVNRIAGNNSLQLSYLGAGSVSNQGAVASGVDQQLGLAEKVTWHRSSFSLIDQLDYAPVAGFDYAGSSSGAPITTGAFATAGSVGLQTGLVPDQSILTSNGQRIGNTAVVEVDTFLTPRSSLTFVGADSILHYFSNDLLDTDEITFQGGYNHLLSRKDSIALLYRFEAFRYSHISLFSQSINDHSVQLSYARRLTGKLAFQITAGPDVTFSRTPIATNALSVSGPGSSGGMLTSSTQYFWDLGSSLTYQLRRTGFTFNYNHGVSGGSGVLAGSVADNASFSANRQLTRRVNGSLNGGYSRNVGLAVTPTSAVTGTAQAFNYWFGGANLTRQWAHSINVSLGYQIQNQYSNSAFCVVAACGKTLVEHMAFLDVGWHPRAITFSER